MIRLRHAIAVWRRMDWLSLCAAAGLAVFGLLFIYSASVRQDELEVTAITLRQAMWISLGAAMLAVMAATDYRDVVRVAPLIYGASLVLLILVLIAGKKVYGATRWLTVAGVDIQPSEFAKLATILLLARYLSDPGTDTAHPKTVAVALLIALLPVALILRQPDLGTAATWAPLVFAMLFVGGTPLRFLLVLAALGVAGMVPAWFLMSGYQRERVLVFLDPSRDPLGSGWNSIQSSIAVGSGGLWGKGFLMGTQNVLGFLPRTVAPTDFIFSVIAEETGFVGCLVLLTLFAALLGGCIRAGLVSRDKVGLLLAAGLAALLFTHVFVNIAMTIGLMPVTGLPLPLVSYGGSFFLSTSALLGLVQSVYARRIRR